MNRRLGATAALVICGTILWWIQPTQAIVVDHMEPERPTMTPRAVAKPSPSPTPSPPAPPAITPDLPEEEIIAASPVEQAAVALAEAMGGYAVSCAPPSNLSDLAAPENAWVDHGIWHLVVEEPAGAVQVREVTPDNSRGEVSLLTWFVVGAGPGQCSFQPLTMVTVKGHIVESDAPLPDVVRCGSEEGAVAIDGTFSLRVERDSGCKVTAFASGWFASAPVGAGSAPPPVHLGPLTPVDTTNAVADLANSLADLALDLEFLAEGANVYEVALADADLSLESREILEGWKSESDASQRRMIQALHDASDIADGVDDDDSGVD